MKKIRFSTGMFMLVLFALTAGLQAQKTGTEAQNHAQNPVIYADVPDMSMIRVGDTYYMSSTTMHMSPGVPIMKSKDLINWTIVNYAYDILDDVDSLNLKNGKSSYGRGSWASCLRVHNKTYYISTFTATTGKTYIYSTKNIEKGPWKKISFAPSYHDNTLFFDDDGRIYLIYGAGRLHIVELKADLSGAKPETDRVLIENASSPAGNNIMLGAEGSQLYKINGKYYLFNITWPRGGMRTVIVHRADKITGPYEGKVALQDLGVAQGGIIDTPDGKWFAFLFRDFGSVGRIPYLVPVKWEDGWPMLGDNGKVPVDLDLPESKGLIPGIVASDEFIRKKGEPDLPLVWQWNHNPDNRLWSVSQRAGFLRLSTARIDTSFEMARNTLTQRTYGPVCSGSTCLDISGMKEGDFAGLCLLQKKFGQVGVKMENGMAFIVMVNGESRPPVEIKRIPLSQKTIFLKAECDYRNRTDLGYFYYSLDGVNWTPIGNQLKMEYSLMQHFMGYRFGLFNYATRIAGGYADFDFFRITSDFSEKITVQAETRTKKQIVPGEQAPPADPGQKNFGGIRPPVGSPVQPRPPRPEPKIQTVSMDEISLSDPFIYVDEIKHMYYLTGTGGRLYKSNDLKMWTGPYPIIDLSGTWMDGLFVAAAEIHHIGNKYYYAGTWSDHSTIIEAVPRRYNVPRNQTQLLVADSPEGIFKPLVADREFCLGPEDWDIIDGTLYEENDTTYMVFVHEWTQLIDGTMDYMPLSKDLTHRTAEPTTIFRASEAAWSKEMNSIGEATFGLKMPGWVTDGPQLFHTKTGKLGMLWSSWGEHRYAQGIAYSASGSIKGPWIQEPEAFKADNSGHGMLFTTFEGKRIFIIHHVEGDGPRKPQMYEVDDSGDILILGNRYHP